MRIAVIIPFRGDPATLAWVLEGFAQQELGDGMTAEVRVHGDGVEVPKAVIPARVNAGVTFCVSSSEHAGVAEAKNGMLRGKPADVLIVSNSDTRPASTDFVRRHVERLMSLPEKSMVLGSAPYESAAAPSVFDVLKEETPMIFFYQGMTPGAWYDFRHVWTLNLSVRYADVERIGFFNPVFRPYGFEDLDIGHRLMGTAKGVYFDPACAVVHRHPMAFDQYMNREELLGRMAPVLHAANEAAFEALYGTRHMNQLAEKFRVWVEMDRAGHAWTYRRMQEWCGLPAEALGAGEGRERLAMALYQMHVPLKRLAFRLGFLRGMGMIADSRWKERGANVGEWCAAIGV
jgi:hypothetical protein